MHLAIALRSVMLTWKEPRQYCFVPRQFPADDVDPGWITPWPFTVETLLLLWPDWIDTAMSNAAWIAKALLATNPSPALRGFRETEFLYPETHP
jgi:hypothetical protein